MHLGGPGRPLHEVLSFFPVQHFGIWNWFGVPDDPPTFETQFEYLVRHELLLAGEHDEAPESQTRPVSIMDAAAWTKLEEKCND